MGDEEELLGADPLAVVDESPEDAKFFEVEIGLAQWGFFLVGSGKNGFDHKFQAIECEAVDAFAEGEPVASG